jgi:hypothetical protein
VYGAEEAATGGQMSRSLVFAASRVPEVHLASWGYVEIVLNGLAKLSFALVVLFGAAGLAAVGGRPGWLRQAYWFVGTGCVALVAALSAWHSARPMDWLQSVTVRAEVAVLALMLIPSALIEPWKVLGNRLDGILWTYFAAELGVVILLSRASTGAWFNYAMQAILFACVLTARAIRRSFDTGSARAVLPVAVAVLLVPAALVLHCVELRGRRQLDRDVLAALFRYYGRPHDEFFFAGRPGDNRVFGRRDLVFDDWLYPVFERARLAEPRSRWLMPRLASGPVTVVVYRSESPTDIGIQVPIEQLDYIPGLHVGPLYSWRRIRPTQGPKRSR